MEEQMALSFTLALFAVVCLAFLLVIRHSSSAAEYHPVQEKSFALRKRIFIVTVLMILPVMLLTMAGTTSYEKALTAGDAIQVRAVGHQWKWSIEPNVIPSRTPIVFNVTSTDVNHGFGIYDASMHLVAQTYGIPGYINELAYTFEQPGTYKVLCLEYCGAAHHLMVAEITVTPVIR